MCKSFAIPTPPDTTNAPLTVDVLCVVFVIEVIPETVSVVPIVAELFTVNPCTVALPFVVNVSPISNEPALPIVAAFIVVPVKVPVRDKPVRVPTLVIFG